MHRAKSATGSGKASFLHIMRSIKLSTKPKLVLLFPAKDLQVCQLVASTAFMVMTPLTSTASLPISDQANEAERQFCSIHNAKVRWKARQRDLWRWVQPSLELTTGTIQVTKQAVEVKASSKRLTHPTCFTRNYSLLMQYYTRSICLFVPSLLEKDDDTWTQPIKTAHCEISHRSLIFELIALPRCASVRVWLAGWLVHMLSLHVAGSVPGSTNNPLQPVHAHSNTHTHTHIR